MSGHDGALPNPRRDEITKRTLYERTGVSEYWIVDPELDAIRVCRRDGERFQSAELTASAGDVLSTPLLPGLELPLSEIFRL